jgi:hypothetical protein
MIERIFPHVNTNIQAVLRRYGTAEDSDATVLLAPFIASKGPANTVQKVYSVTEFESIYGAIDFKTQGQSVANIYNWLTNGGAVLALRLVGSDGEKAQGTLVTEGGSTLLTATAEHEGTYYNDIKLQFRKSSVGTMIDVRVLLSGRIIQTVSRLDSNSFVRVLNSLGLVNIDVLNFEAFYNYLTASWTDVELTGGADSDSSLDDLVIEFFEGKATTVLGNKLDTSIDVFLDFGLSTAAKEAVATFTTEKEGSIRRHDFMVFFDTKNFIVGEDSSLGNLGWNHAVYDQTLTVNNLLTNGNNEEVTATYALANLLPFNDRTYGVQWPTAGQTRGVIRGITQVSSNPNDTEKALNYSNRLNYIEKDARGYYFMSQLTRDEASSEGYRTALAFVNNARTTLKMVKELEILGRQYLFEFNDSATLKNMSNALNRYVNEWIQKRALSEGNVIVEKNPFSDEKVDVTLTIKFTGIIEIVSINLVIE